jgi:pathogenesis-related protein 1
MKPVAIVIQLVATLIAFPGYAGDIDVAAMIDAHNKWRAEVGISKKLSYSPALAISAQAWVDNLKRTNHCHMRHSSPQGRYGENLYWSGARVWSNGRRELVKVSAADVVDTWGSEKANYDHDNNLCAQGEICGHYAQIVWRDTTRVGCAMAVCGDTKEQVWACQYQPAGNWEGRTPY